MKSYSELITIPTFKERYIYLKLDGKVGKETFGYDRYLNQLFYHSDEWRKFRDSIILRDNGNDLGVDNYPINGRILIHHINPIYPEDIIKRSQILFDPENVISVSKSTHNAIHYGDESLLFLDLTERLSNDTCPWR